MGPGWGFRFMTVITLLCRHRLLMGSESRSQSEASVTAFP